MTFPGSSAGKWDYTQCHHAASYGDDTTYRIGAAWLEGLSIEDWGCGLGWFKKFHAGQCIGIDGSPSDASDVIVDLSGWMYSRPEGIFMRHVLEHNENWRQILWNAARAFRRRMAIVVFTPFEDVAVRLTPPWADIPDFSLVRADFAGILWAEGSQMAVQRVESKTFYGAETVFLAEKRT